MNILSTAYLAPIEHYVRFYHDSNVVIEAHEHYIKQTLRNRCTIATSHGAMQLTLPVEKSAKQQCPIRDVRISSHGNWQHLHWNALRSAYNQTPFFEYYEDDFAPFYHNTHTFLFDYNEALRELLFCLLPIHQTVIHTAQYTPDSSFTKNTPTTPPYYQVFDRKIGFIPNLSIVDLLFNLGPEAVLYLHQHPLH